MEKRSNIKLTLDQGLAVAHDMAPDRSSIELARILGVPQAYLLRRSVDARRKNDVHFIATVGVPQGSHDAAVLQPVVPLTQRPTPQPAGGDRPVVVGAGPAGLFAALALAEAGRCPLLIERGASVQERTADVERFHATRVLNPKSNIQFGEGGAGTFSDGKLTCGKHSPLTATVLETFAAAGAPAEILWQAKPHIGTDVLVGVVAELRKRIVACGGEVRFHTQLVGLEQRSNASGGRELAALVLEGPSGEQERVEAHELVLAIGHSARDTFELLRDAGLQLEQKPFSMGVRIEHAQEAINRAQYGRAAAHPALGAADYKLACHLGGGRSAYTFCMCPGGEVVAAASEQGRLCVNGMSRHARAGANANAALLVNVEPTDFGDAANPLAGIALQRTWEEAAFRAGGGDWCAPVQTVGEFVGCAGRRGSEGTLTPSYPLGVNSANLDTCLPSYITAALRDALPIFGRKLRGFDDAQALLTGIEARSSSPVRIVRDAKTLQATRLGGVFPCGEGAGYAGGIVSAAIDGLRVAMQLGA